MCVLHWNPANKSVKVTESEFSEWFILPLTIVVCLQTVHFDVQIIIVMYRSIKSLQFILKHNTYKCRIVNSVDLCNSDIALIIL